MGSYCRWRGAACSSWALQATPFQEDWIFMGILGSLRAGILKGFDDFAPEQHEKNSYWNKPEDCTGHQPAPVGRAARLLLSECIDRDSHNSHRFGAADQKGPKEFVPSRH